MAKTETHNATVTRNTDEDLGVALRGAVFFEAPTLFDGEYPQPALPCFPFASAKGAGMFYVPKVGDEIEVLIRVDDPQNPHDTDDAQLPEPRWIAMIYSDVSDIFSEFQKNYPFRMGWVSNSGHHMIFDDTEGEELVRFAHTVGTFFEMDQTGDYSESIQRNKIVEIFGDKRSNIQKTKAEFIGGNHEVDIKKDKIETIRGDYTLEVLGKYLFKHQGNLENEVNELKQTMGSLEQIIRGARSVKVDGGNSDIIGGADTRAVLGNQNTTVSGKSNRLVAQVDEQTYGLGSKETIATLNKEFIVLLGNFLVTITAGNINLRSVVGTSFIGNAIGGFTTNLLGQIKIQGPPGSELLDIINQLITLVDDTLTLINTMLTNIQAITVPTAVGPSGPPVNSPAFLALQTPAGITLLKTTLTAIKLLLTAMKA